MVPEMRTNPVINNQPRTCILIVAAVLQLLCLKMIETSFEAKLKGAEKNVSSLKLR